MPTPVSIIIPAFNQLEYCRQCLTTLLANTSYPYKLILVDNGSTDGVAEFFDSVPGATVVHSPTNVGFAAGINLGLAHAEGHALLLNSDTLLPIGWLERLVTAMESAPDIGMAGPKSNCVSGSQLIEDLEFTTVDEINAFAAKLDESHGSTTRDVARLVGFCLLIRDSVWQSLGGLDESFGIGNYEDDDYCLRTLRAGYRLCIAEGAFVFHYGSRTFLGMGIHDDAWRDLMARNETLFREKWQAAPDERSDAAQQARVELRRAEQLLAVGNTVAALEACVAAQRIAPSFDQVYNDMGAVLWALDRREEAIHQFKRAMKLNPGSEDAKRNYREARAALTGTGRVLVREYRDADESEWMRLHAVILSISHAWNYSIQERPAYDGFQSTRLVAELDGKLVGLLDVKYDRELGELCLLADSPGGYVLEFGRLPECGGLGIGEQLMEAAKLDATSKGFSRLEYWSQDRAAQRFYRRLGLPEIGRHYRFRFRAPKEIAELAALDHIGIEYLYGACMPEEWPLVKQKYDIITEHPLEPHLCVGFEVRW